MPIIFLCLWKLFNTGWSKILYAPDDYNTEVRCTETFWLHCRMSQFAIWSVSQLSSLLINIYHLTACNLTFTHCNKLCAKIWNLVPWHLYSCFQDFISGIVITPGGGRPKNRGSFPCKNNEFFPSANRPAQLWSPPSLQFSVAGVLFPGGVKRPTRDTDKSI